PAVPLSATARWSPATLRRWGRGDVTDDAVLELNTGGDFDNAISGSGQVVKSGDDVLTLSGANELQRRHAHQRRHAGRQQR
ncbi:ShdA, partial [Salmonella enterica subsp. enterica serovar Agona str. SA-1]